jgi:hypothetical protein
MISVPGLLAGQLETVDSASSNLVSDDTVIVENILKTPELQVKKTPEKVSSAASSAPVIPMPVPEMNGMRYPDLPMLPRYTGYESIKSILKYTDPKYNTTTLKLNLNLPPPKNILDLIRENPLRALYYGVGTLAGKANNTVMGEDKMNMLRLEYMIQSRSGIPETAISGNKTVYYEIDIKRTKY